MKGVYRRDWRPSRRTRFIGSRPRGSLVYHIRPLPRPRVITRPWLRHRFIGTSGVPQTFIKVHGVISGSKHAATITRRGGATIQRTWPVTTITPEKLTGVITEREISITVEE